MIYLDNNATTMMPPAVKRELIRWCNRGNPSAGYAAARDSRAMMEQFRAEIRRAAGVDDRYRVVFTSGGSEANAAVIHHFCTRGGRNHVIASGVEHKSILQCLNNARDRGQIMLTVVPPRADGTVSVDDIKAAFRPDTTLICVMHANNETGAINNTAALAEYARSVSVHFHSDTVQTFGKIAIPTPAPDSFAVSFHKIHGPSGIGVLVFRGDIIPLICGSQNDGMRGGTENLAGIGAARMGLTMTIADRDRKNRRQRILKQILIKNLRTMASVISFAEYLHAPRDGIVLFSDASNQYLPGTLLLSVVTKSGKICNVKIKQTLGSRGVIVSIGSACNTSSANASHVLHAMNADEAVRKGALRISLGDETTYEEIKKFTVIFGESVNKVLTSA